jgi:membrane protease YdiL (CAAX protease family)
MKICGYCGKANEDATLFCVECGTAFDVPNETRTPPVSTQKDPPGTLNAKIATIILIAYAAAQILCGCLIAVIASKMAAEQGIHNLRQVNLISHALDPVGLVLSFVLGGLVMVLMSLALIPKHLKDTSPNGAAWVAGRWEIVVKGLIIGLIIGVCNEALAMIIKHHGNLNPLHWMAFTPGLPQIIWVLVTVLLAPPVEEMLFRGVLYGGYQKSFGPVWAAVFTTFLFVVIHFPYYIHFLPAIIGIVAATLATLRFRLRWNAIGPAIAVHVGYNFVLALSVVYWTWH